MAKIKLPYWLDAVWGKVQKNNVVFRRAKKTIVLESDPTPSYTRTDAQAYVRSKYYDALKNWYSLSESDKKLYNEKGSKLGLSGWNVYVMETMKGVAYQPFNYEITINNSQNNNTLTDYQVLLNISNDSVFFSTIQDKKFMEFYDEDKQTLLNHYVELWDAQNYNAKIWIKIPNITASSTKKIYLKKNSSRTTDLSNGKNVFCIFEDFGNLQSFQGENDFSYSSYELTTSAYISPPSSFHSLDHGDRLMFLNKQTANIPEGEALFYCKVDAWNSYGFNVGTLPIFVFRNQKTINTTPDFSNCYYILLHNQRYTLRKCLNGSETNIVDATTFSSGLTLSNDTWYWFKVRWYKSGNSLKVAQWIWYNNQWTVLHTEQTDSSPYFEGSNVNRFGLGGWGQVNNPRQEWYDDLIVRKFSYPEPTVSYVKL